MVAAAAAVAVGVVDLDVFPFFVVFSDVIVVVAAVVVVAVVVVSSVVIDASMG